MNKLRLGLAVAGLATLLAGCTSAVGDADAGPDPGGGFYYGSNISVGHINPSLGDLYYEPYTSLGQLNP
jgi:hypothetical protein